MAFMRGRTLNDSFVILDEAQNATSEQMKMFVTRLGFGSKAVITGDVTQIDLPPRKRSGLLDAVDVLSGVEGISFIYFNEKDVVRHDLVQRIIRAYEQYKGRNEQLALTLEARSGNDYASRSSSGQVPSANIQREVSLVEAPPIASPPTAQNRASE